MNNKERLCWTLALILVAFFANSKMDYIQNLQTLNESYQINSQLKSDQMLDLMHEINNNDSLKYREGFEAGKTQAMLASMDNESIYNYTDGYHAAINQMQANSVMDEKGVNSPEIYDLFLDILDMYADSDKKYQELLNLVANDN